MTKDDGAASSDGDDSSQRYTNDTHENSPDVMMKDVQILSEK